MFDELLTPPSSVDLPAPEDIAPIDEVVALVPVVSTGSHSSTTVDQDAPSPSNSQTTPETQPPVISNDSDSIHTIVHPDHQISEHDSKWTKDHSLENIIGELDRPVFTRLQLHEQALFCYYDAFLTVVEPKTYKDALTQSCWIEAMQEELNEFERLEVWELVPRPPKPPGLKFEDPPFEEEILTFIRELGYSSNIKLLYEVKVDTLPQPWRTFETIINKCLSGKVTGIDTLRLS
ncbi:hypothetical protein Tco_1027591 [Tanacetum coccineum]